MALGAGFGLIFGLLMLEGWWIGPVVGVAVGLIVGAVIDSQGRKGRHR